MVEHKTFLTTHNKLKDHRRASAAFRVLWVGNLDYMTTQEEASTTTNYAPGVAAETTPGATSSTAQATFGDAAMAMRVEGYDMDLWKMPQRPAHYWTGLDNRDYDRIEDGRDTIKPEPDTGRFFPHEIESKEGGDFQPTWTPQGGNVPPNLSLYTQPHLPSDMESKEEHPTQSHGRGRGHSI
ncbi:hypothetical protein SCUP515_02325 [Seiridium cupressi]